MALLNFWKRESTPDSQRLARNFSGASPRKKRELIHELTRRKGMLSRIWMTRRVAARIKESGAPFRELYDFEMNLAERLHPESRRHLGAEMLYSGYYRRRSIPYTEALKKIRSREDPGVASLIDRVAEARNRDGFPMLFLILQQEVENRWRKSGAELRKIYQELKKVLDHWEEIGEDLPDSLYSSFDRYRERETDEKTDDFLRAVEKDDRFRPYLEDLQERRKKKPATDKTAKAPENTTVLGSGEGGRSKNGAPEQNRETSGESSGEPGGFETRPRESQETGKARKSFQDSADQYRKSRDPQELKLSLLNEARKIKKESGEKGLMKITEELLGDPDTDPVVRKFLEKLQGNLTRSGPTPPPEPLDRINRMDDPLPEEPGRDISDREELEFPSSGNPDAGPTETRDNQEEDSRARERKKFLEEMERQLSEEKEESEKHFAILDPEMLEEPEKIRALFSEDLEEEEHHRIFEKLAEGETLLNRILRLLDRLSRHTTPAELRTFLERLIEDLKKQPDILKQNPRLLVYLENYRDSLREKPSRRLAEVYQKFKNTSAESRTPERNRIRKMDLLEELIRNPENRSIRQKLLGIYRELFTGSPEQPSTVWRSGKASLLELKLEEALIPAGSPSRFRIQGALARPENRRLEKSLEKERSGVPVDFRRIERFLEKVYRGEPFLSFKRTIREENRARTGENENQDAAGSHPVAPEEPEVFIDGTRKSFTDAEMESTIRFKKAFSRLVSPADEPETRLRALREMESDGDPEHRSTARYIREMMNSKEEDRDSIAERFRSELPDKTLRRVRQFHTEMHEKALFRNSLRDYSREEDPGKKKEQEEALLLSPRTPDAIREMLGTLREGGEPKSVEWIGQLAAERLPARFRMDYLEGAASILEEIPGGMNEEVRSQLFSAKKGLYKIRKSVEEADRPPETTRTSGVDLKPESDATGGSEFIQEKQKNDRGSVQTGEENFPMLPDSLDQLINSGLEEPPVFEDLEEEEPDESGDDSAGNGESTPDKTGGESPPGAKTSGNFRKNRSLKKKGNSKAASRSSSRPAEKTAGGILGGLLSALPGGPPSKGTSTRGTKKNPVDGKKSGSSIDKKSGDNQGSDQGKKPGQGDTKKLIGALEKTFQGKLQESGTPLQILQSLPTRSELEEELRNSPALKKEVSPDSLSSAAEQIASKIAVTILVPREIAAGGKGDTLTFPRKFWANDSKRKTFIEACRSLASDQPPGSIKQKYYSFIADEMEHNYYKPKYKR